MAIEATQRTIYDGTRNVHVLLTGICDGTGSDENNVVKVDVSELNPVGNRVKIKEVEAAVSGGAVKLSWDAAPPEDFLVLEGNAEFCFESIDGLPNTADAETATGDILLSTVGFDLNSTYSILLKMIKK